MAIMRHAMYYLDRFGKKTTYYSQDYKHLKEQMLELSHTKDVGDIYYIDPVTKEEKVLCYYND